MKLEENVLYDLIVSYELGHCDLFSYKSLIKVIYNDPGQFYIFLLFAVPNISILLEINDFYMFSKIKYIFRFSYRAQAGTSYFFLSNN